MIRTRMHHLLRISCHVYGLVVVLLAGALLVTTAITLDIAEISWKSYYIFLYVVALVFFICFHVFVIWPYEKEKKLKPDYVLDIPRVAYYGEEENELQSFNSRLERQRRQHMSVNTSRGKQPIASLGGEGINVYLQAGAMVFAVGNILQEIFNLVSLYVDKDYSSYCRGPLYTPDAIIHSVFVGVQTYYLFRYHKLCIHVHESWVRFGFVHLVATNLAVWVMAAVEETMEELRDMYGGEGDGGTEEGTSHLTDYSGSAEEGEMLANFSTAGAMALSTHAPAWNASAAVIAAGEKPELTDLIGKCIFDYEETLSGKASPYLMPCTVEYSLIAVAVFYQLYANMGPYVGTKSGARGTEPPPSPPMGHPMFHKARMGLIPGLVVLGLTLASMGCFFAFGGGGEEGSYTSFLIFAITEMVLFLTALTALILGFVAFRTFRLAKGKGEGIDRLLLLVAYCGLIMYYLLITLAASASIGNFGAEARLTVVNAIFGLLMGTLQALFILDALRRVPGSRDHVERKPGRRLVTFLLLLNLSLWFLTTFEVDAANAIYTEYYGEVAWAIMSHLTMPLVIFFHFHSTACMSDIWISAYESEDHN